MPKPTNTHSRPDALADVPATLRARATGIAPGDDRVERTGGQYGAGLIRGVSMCTRGEALGHRMWLDQQFIAQVAQAASGDARGVKARFTHPSLSGDGLGKFLGRFTGGRVTEDGQQAVAELHIAESAHDAPDGDLADYVMDLAEEDPAAFATSIVFEHDRQAEQDLILAHGGQWKDDPEYGRYLSLENFRSPDPANTNNYPHARLSRLRACDAVDDPAANPNGLFHREQQFAQEADALAGYAFGLTDQPPALSAFAVHPERVRVFLAKYLDAHGLQIVRQTKEPSMPPTDNTTAQQNQNPAEQPTETCVEPLSSEPVAPAASPAGENAPAASTPPSDARAECRRFTDAFGLTNGATWYGEGLSFEAAQARHLAALASENEALRKRLETLGQQSGEAGPLSVAPGQDAGGDGNRFVNRLTPGLAKYAASLKRPNV